MWNTGGFLNSRGVLDFAGGITIHIPSGTLRLVANVVDELFVYIGFIFTFVGEIAAQVCWIFIHVSVGGRGTLDLDMTLYDELLT